MEKKIKWRDGMEIGPEVFEQTDRFHLSKVQELGKFLACERHGLLEAQINLEQEDDLVNVDIPSLFALARNGSVVRVENLKKKINTYDDGFIVVRKKGTTVVENKGVTLETPYFDCICTSKTDKGDIIVGIIEKHHLKGSYFPPCYRLSAYRSLRNLYELCINLFYAIREIIKVKEVKGNLNQLDLFAVDLNNLGLQDSPKNLYLLLLKITVCLNGIHPSLKLPEIPPFDDMDSAASLILMRDNLEKYFHDLDNIAEPVKENSVEEKKVERKFKFKY